jgi:hypothetical protein
MNAGDRELVLALDTETAAELAGAAGVLPQAVLEYSQQRQARLHDLDRIVARGRAPRR